MARETIFLDIDTQWDFVMAEGAAPVAGAFALVPNWERLTRTARTNDIQVIATAQSLPPGDPRFGEATPWCVAGTPGQLKVPATRPKPGVVLPNRPAAAGEVEKLVREAREIVVETTGPDLLTHPAMEALLAGTKQAYLFGLFADEAVLKAARELRRLGLAVTVATDALCARSQEPEALARAIADMVALGAEARTTMQIMTRYAAVKRH